MMSTADAGGVLVWVTGWPGVGKSTVGDYLDQECGFAHVDVDNDFMVQIVGHLLPRRAPR